jgi:hypothetical protein
MVENFFLFFRSLVGSWMVWVGGILRVIPFLEHFIERKLQGRYPRVAAFLAGKSDDLKKNLTLIAVLCLFIGCYRTWVFEHRNAGAAMYGKDGKSEAWARYNECNADNREYAAISRTFNSQLNDKQRRIDSQQDIIDSQLSTVTSCVASLTTANIPERLRVTTRSVAILWQKPTTLIVLAETNKTIPAFVGKITCPAQFFLMQAAMVSGAISSRPETQQTLRQNEVKMDFHGQPWRPQEPIVALIQGEELTPGTCAISSQ